MFGSHAPRSPRTRPHGTARTTLRARAVRILATCALAVPALLVGAASGTAAEAPGVYSPATSPTPAGPQGVDVSSAQGPVDWAAVYQAGIRFTYLKATEGTSYTDPRFDVNYAGSLHAGLIRGAYHFARPGLSSGAAQAVFFVNNGGEWTADGMTLPPLLDLEYNPSGSVCYGMSATGMVSWIRDFSDTVKSLTGRYPAIYTTTTWWKQCTGNSGAFGRTNPLVIGHWGGTVGELPNWPTWTIWQYGSGQVDGVSGTAGLNVFNGDLTGLRAFARCTLENPC